MLGQTDGIADLLLGVFEDAPVGLVLLDPDRRYLLINDALATLHGLPAADHIGKRLEEVAPDVAALLEPVLSRVMAGETVADLELDMGPGATLEGFFPVRDGSGQIVAAAGVVIDVTDLRHARDSERYLRELLGEELRAERRIANALQRSLLPRTLPMIPGAALTARYEAAGSRFEVGGDFYDAFPLPGDRWLLAVGDVCGKGPEAAGVTAMARYTLRAAAPSASGPAELLSRLNDEMLRHEHSEADEILRFVTVALACVQPVQNGRFAARIAAAGHPDPLIVRAGGAVEHFEASGPPCGVQPGDGYEESSAELAPGDALLLYTDGVLEAGAPERQLSVAELASLLAGHAGEPSDRLADAVADTVSLLGEPEPRDDYAVLALGIERRRTPRGSIPA